MMGAPAVTYPEKLPRQEADGALNRLYRASRYFKLNTIATMAKTSGQKMLASGPTVPPVSQCGPLSDALRRLWEGSKPLFGTPKKNVWPQSYPR